MAVEEVMLTTVDNPHSPFDDWREWFAFDTRHGYHTCALLDRVLHSSDEISEPDALLLQREACEEIVRENVSGMHRLVTRKIEDPEGSVRVPLEP